MHFNPIDNKEFISYIVLLAQGQHGGLVDGCVTSHQEGPRFESRPEGLPGVCVSYSTCVCVCFLWETAVIPAGPKHARLGRLQTLNCSNWTGDLSGVYSLPSPCVNWTQAKIMDKY